MRASIAAAGPTQAHAIVLRHVFIYGAYWSRRGGRCRLTGCCNCMPCHTGLGHDALGRAWKAVSVSRWRWRGPVFRMCDGRRDMCSTVRHYRTAHMCLSLHGGRLTPAFVVHVLGCAPEMDQTQAVVHRTTGKRRLMCQAVSFLTSLTSRMSPPCPARCCLLVVVLLLLAAWPAQLAGGPAAPLSLEQHLQGLGAARQLRFVPLPHLAARLGDDAAAPPSSLLPRGPTHVYRLEPAGDANEDGKGPLEGSASGGPSGGSLRRNDVERLRDRAHHAASGGGAQQRRALSNFQLRSRLPPSAKVAACLPVRNEGRYERRQAKAWARPACTYLP